MQAEQVAAATAVLWVLQLRTFIPRIEGETKFDCMAAGLTADGTWAAGDFMGTKLHQLTTVAQATERVTLSLSHVKGHSNDPWHDLADYVAKASAKGQATWPAPPPATCSAVMQPELAWLPVELDALRHGAMPIATGAITWSTSDFSPYQLDGTSLIPVRHHGGGKTPLAATTFKTKIATINIQGLRGKCKYVEDQLDDLGIQLALLQETKTPSGVCMTRKYFRLHTDAASHWGVAIWIHKRLGIISTEQGPLRVEESDAQVLVDQERLLILLVQLADLRIGVISAHCSHSARAKEREEFLADFEQGINRIKSANLILGGADFNARVPVGFEGVSGDLEYGEPDEVGWKLASLLANGGIWLPSTYQALHIGESATYVHPSGRPHRIDYTLLGGSSVVQRARSELEQSFDNASPQEDHKMLGLSLEGLLEPASSAPRLVRTKFDCDKILSAEGRNIVRAFKQPAWSCHPDEHCKALENHLQGILSEFFRLALPNMVPLIMCRRTSGSSGTRRQTSRRGHAAEPISGAHFCPVPSCSGATAVITVLNAFYANKASSTNSRPLLSSSLPLRSAETLLLPKTCSFPELQRKDIKARPRSSRGSNRLALALSRQSRAADHSQLYVTRTRELRLLAKNSTTESGLSISVDRNKVAF